MQDLGSRMQDPTVLSTWTDFIRLLRRTRARFFATFLTLWWLVQLHQNPVFYDEFREPGGPRQWLCDTQEQMLDGGAMGRSRRPSRSQIQGVRGGDSAL